MNAITLRAIPPETERRIQELAEERGISLNKAVLALLEESAGKKGSERRVRHHDLDHLVGRWKKRDADRFEQELLRQRAVDPELWR